MKVWVQLAILIAILVGSSIILTIQKQGYIIKREYSPIEKENPSETSFQEIEEIADNIFSQFPDVKIFGESYQIEEIKKDNLFGYEFYKISGKIGNREIEFYLSKDLKNVVFYMNIGGRNLLQFISIEDLKNMIAQQSPKKSEKPDVKLFIMSFCPYGNQMEQQFLEIIKILGNKINFEPVYIYYDGKMYDNNANYCMEVNGKYYCSMHGIKELEQDLREKAIYKLYGAEKWAEYVREVDNNCNLNNIDNCWKEIAVDLGISTEEVEQYVEENKNQMILDDYELSSRYNAWASPTLFVNDVQYNYYRDSKYVFKFICASFTEKPEECSTEIQGVPTQAASVGSCG